MADIFCIHHTKTGGRRRALNWPSPRPRSMPARPSPPSSPVPAPTCRRRCHRGGGHLCPVWKFDNDELAYPNAEVIRKLLVKVLPADAIVLIPHDTFGMDLGPGLSIKLDPPSPPTSWISKAWTAAPEGRASGIRRHGQHPCDLDISRRVCQRPPGAFQAPDESNAAGGRWKTNPAMSAT
jgi:hypothetical protein